MLETGQARKPDLVNSTPCNRETIPAQSKDSSLFFLQTKDKLKLLERNKQLLTKLGSRLSHGKEEEMKLAIEVINFLFLSSGKTSLEDFEIHLKMIHTELVLGPPGSFSQIIDGLLLESTALYQTATVNRNTVTESQLLVAALVDGDVTSEFRHAGLNKEIQVHRIIENKEDFKASVFNPEKDWYQRVTKTLRNYQIGILVVKGIVQDSVLDYCSSHGIVVLQSVTYPTLQLLSFATDSTIVTYLADLREQDIGRPVTIETWELGWAPSLVRQSKSQFTGMKSCQYVLVKDVKREIADCTDLNSPLQTVLLCSPCKDLLCDMEERFWNSIHRLKNALACGRVLPGAGKIELACIRRLNESAGELVNPQCHATLSQDGYKKAWSFSDLCLLTQEALWKFLNGFKMRRTINMNSRSQKNHAHDHVPNLPARDPAGFSVNSSGDPVGSKLLSRDIESLVWDDYTAKKEAWRRAVGLVRILLQSDMLVETGLGRNDREAVLF
ncbi:chaperone-mediated protein complex assembly [Desmophyllum pertusum]|uniref:Chaperone-mediated protein complex assembly n=1 Tax=Desmophyllum pertusum TaxID=174260 RepID=A0A9X0D8U9_9CNID|nr:chaperone-mediated protein complex assembly [Desmophyllum pertusum]